MEGPVATRTWFIKEDDTELIQIQSDRFLHNWRRRKDSNDYPRYEAIRERFFSELHEVQAFFEQEKIGSIEPNQCEVTYVNHIKLPDGTDPRGSLHRIFSNFQPIGDLETDVPAQIPPLEEAGLRLRFIIPDPDSDEPRGRLHVRVDPAIEDENIILRMDLTARGAPRSPTFESIASFLDIGRETIVRGFSALTTSEMHDFWGRIK